ncbi:MAG: hypothetical protein ABI723_25310 [Bacteroidia bacterium]
MKDKVLKSNAIKNLYPDEWILLGNPEIKDAEILSGTVLFHSKEKKPVVEFAKNVIDHYEQVKIFFTGRMSKISRLGIFNVIEVK